MEDNQSITEGKVRMLLDGIEISANSADHNKTMYKAMGKYGENLAVSFALFLTREGWMKLSNSDEWIKISSPHPSFLIEEVYKFFIDHN